MIYKLYKTDDTGSNVIDCILLSEIDFVKLLDCINIAQNIEWVDMEWVDSVNIFKLRLTELYNKN